LAFVAQIIDEPAIAKLEAHVAELEALVASSPTGKLDAEQISVLAEEFRGTIEAAVGNSILTRAVKSLDVLSTAARERALSAVPAGRLLDNHRRMVEALARRDPHAAQRALEEYLDYLGEVNQVTLRGASRGQADAAGRHRGRHRRRHRAGRGGRPVVVAHAQAPARNGNSRRVPAARPGTARRTSQCRRAQPSGALVPGRREARQPDHPLDAGRLRSRA